MHPILVEIGPLTLYTYGLMLAVAFLVASWRAQAAARRWPDPPAPLDAPQVVSLCTVVMLGGLIGARVFFVAANLEVFLFYPLEILAIWHGGLVWYGGLAGGLVAGEWFLRAKGLPRLRALDQLAPFAALGHAIGRIGCFLNGCCYGKLTAAWFGVRFPEHLHPVVPTQLIESAALGVMFVGLRLMQRPAVLRRPGTVLWSYLLSYAVLRFVIEFWRGDQHLYIREFTLQQVISLVLGVAALLALMVSFASHASHLPSRRRSR